MGFFCKKKAREFVYYYKSVTKGLQFCNHVL